MAQPLATTAVRDQVATQVAKSARTVPERHSEVLAAWSDGGFRQPRLDCNEVTVKMAVGRQAVTACRPSVSGRRLPLWRAVASSMECDAVSSSSWRASSTNLK